ncbi:MAG: sugar phosphate isomerase/epimerase [Acidobacteria bacterium]|nr:sugar phosphate isomerase/epimerase [Acidobacteriota bacterium]
MTGRPGFGISTHLFHGERLSRPHLEAIASAGFELVEVFATRTHVAYHEPSSVADLRRQLDALHLEAWSVHAPICDGFVGGVWGRPYSNATTDARARAEAVSETRLAIDAARVLGCRMIVLHLGLPNGQPIPSNDNDRSALQQSLEPIAEACAAARVRLALEVIPNDLATPEALVEWLSGDLELGDAGVCLDVGHAHLVGGAPEAAETLAGYVITTHIHDNRGRSDDHLVPFDGTIDWHATLMTLSKIGYTGPLVFELPDHGDAAGVLRRAVDARRRLQAILDDLAQPLDFVVED